MALSAEQRRSLAALHNALPVLADERIRLLAIRPGSFNEPLRCDLATSDPNAEYEALSYSWSLTGSNIYDVINQEDKRLDSGVKPRKFARKSSQPAAGKPAEQRPVEANETILVNGHSIPVMANLSAALNHIRHTTTSRVLWIDFLCINQTSESDKTHQVRRMASIYTNATNVIVWLGLETPADASALTELRQLAQNKHFDEIYPGRRPKQMSQALIPLVDLFSRPWFNRMWVIQEIVLSYSATVRIGRLSEPWSTFLAARDAWMKHRICCASIVFSSGFWLGKSIEIIEHAVPDPVDFWRSDLNNALYKFRWREASDPVDKVFSLLGVVEPERGEWPPEVRVDYSLSQRHVYEQTTLYMIRTMGNLRCIAESGVFSDCSSLPSWTADLKFLNEDACFMNNEYNACLYYTGAAAVTRCSDGLRMEGIFWDKVVEVSENKLRYRSEPGSAENIRLVHAAITEYEAMARSPASRRSPYGAEDARLEALADTLQEGWSKRRQKRITREDQADYNEWRRWLERAVRSKVLRRLTAKEKFGAIQSILLNGRKAFFTTSGGFFGLGLPGAEAGDLVCVMRGSKVPLLLRMANQRCNECAQICYRIVGYCYVHGIMDGEAVKEVRKGEIKSATICIR